MHIFYTPEISNEYHTLDKTESRHCIKVLRLKKDDIIFLIDGKGGFYTAKILETDPYACKIQITNKQIEYGKRKYKLHIAIAPTKSIDKFEFFVEKTTEMGIDEITPVIFHRSERKSLNIQRLNKIIISAMKQSVNVYLPKIHNIINFEAFINNNTFPGQKFIAIYSEKEKFLKSEYKSGQNALIVIGPEGDFTKEEINIANTNDFINVSLGTNRLRTETAGIAACHTIYSANLDHE
ncbi:MAG: 16S rRNA (uracil(1498)-N(3))-methyltransferase [Bacteroidia bacterium]|nr:16S rRNA (uracil(1498)-N(3))-methyltransferase [Bacteroidia bacterium]